MSVSDLDIQRAARQMMKRFNADASLEAALRADAALDAGDMFNFDVWTRVAKAITTLEASVPASTSQH